MDANKYPRPSLPTMQQILDDIHEPKVIKEGMTKKVLKYATDSETTCYDAIKELEHNLSTQKDLFENIDMLKQKLVENVEIVRKRHKSARLANVLS